MRTYAPRPRDIERRWYVIDAGDAVLGRVATQIAAILRGKHKPIYAPHADTGDHVIVINAAGVRLTGGKEHKKVAYRHSGHPGGITATGYERLLAERPAFAVEKAVKGMLPKNRLGRAMLRKLVVYESADHPHAAQQPQRLALGEYPAWDGLPAGPSKAAGERGGRQGASPRKRGARSSRAAPEGKAAAGEATPTATPVKSAAKRQATTGARSAAKKPAAKKPAAKKPAAKTSARTSKGSAGASAKDRPTARRQPPADGEGQDG
jgi:large subunit ribosomal protein L13